MTKDKLKRASFLDDRIENIREALRIAVGNYAIVDIVVRDGDNKKTLSFRLDNSDFAKSVIEELRNHKKDLESEFEKL
ncbi:hypothetical protein [Sphingobacterium thalpophilum]|uniref:hypothetical protein n=1 Tax=Sphingobacterium thalpophilum TaxID=259 RepID=UPI003D9559C7